MRNALLRLAVAALIVSVCIAAAAAAVAQSGYTLDWWTVDSGGGRSTGGPYALGGAAGQPDAGSASGGGYTLSGGFWAGTALDFPHRLYLPAAAHNASGAGGSINGGPP